MEQVDTSTPWPHAPVHTKNKTLAVQSAVKLTLISLWSEDTHPSNSISISNSSVCPYDTN